MLPTTQDLKSSVANTEAQTYPKDLKINYITYKQNAIILSLKKLKSQAMSF